MRMSQTAQLERTRRRRSGPDVGTCRPAFPWGGVSPVGPHPIHASTPRTGAAAPLPPRASCKEPWPHQPSGGGGTLKCPPLLPNLTAAEGFGS